MKHDELLAVNDASDFLKITKSTLYTWVHQRKIPYRKHGNRLVFSKQDLLDWSESLRVAVLEDIHRVDG